jgi:hypothetical protein
MVHACWAAYIRWQRGDEMETMHGAQAAPRACRARAAVGLSCAEKQAGNRGARRRSKEFGERKREPAGRPGCRKASKWGMKTGDAVSCGY